MISEKNSVHLYYFFSMPHAPFSIPCLYESVHESNRITIVDLTLKLTPSLRLLVIAVI
ncbi:hypothetical protein IQ246_06085 [aff. Roholtiella sp. LEGE 12411]|nr:hypothetical protein [aff. Roholtiella sp. LEGE 12411]